ncbi:YHYH domain-containing protein [Amylibacter sp. IMCC11727]|nr:YHYH domain-containing protein [Amylibacter sp. IMCC11727]WGI22374.1 YHYH domain-containing protein [Amylibacter sp. IMCC11727]
MKNLIITAILALTVSLPYQAIAHSGGTNAAGCHAGSKPYHCH